MTQQPIVYPRTGVLANLEHNDFNPLNRRIGHNTPPVTILRMTRIHAPMGFKGYAVVDFVNDWTGYQDLIWFEHNFNDQGKGKRGWMASGPKQGIYGWIANSEDFFRPDALGRALRHGRTLQTVDAVERMQRHQLEFLTQEVHRIDVLRTIERNAQAAVGQYGGSRAHIDVNQPGPST